MAFLTVHVQQVFINIQYVRERSYAIAVRKVRITIPAVSPATKSYMVEDTFSVQLNEKAFAERLTFCHHSLIAQMVLSKGEKPWKLADLKVMLYEILKFQRWKLISMGKGFFYQVFLFSVSDKQRIWSNGSLLLKPRILSLWEWTPYFNSELQHSRMCKFR